MRQEIADTLPLLKPDLAENLIDKIDVSSFRDISSLLPFMNSDALTELAMEYAKRGNSVNELLPFLDEDDITQLALKILRNKKK